MLKLIYSLRLNDLIRLILLFISLFVWSLHVKGEQSNTYTLTANSKQVNLNNYVGIKEGKSDTFQLESILSSDISQWANLSDNAINIQQIEAVWLRICIYNATDSAFNYYIHISPPYLGYSVLWFNREDLNNYKYSSRQHQLNNYFKKVNLPARDTSVFYIKINKPDPYFTAVNLELIDHNLNTASLKKRHLSQGVFQGIMAFLFLFHLLVFLYARDLTYVFYSQYILVSATFFLFYYGFIQEYFGIYNFNNNYFWILSNSILIFYLLFMRHFLYTQSQFPILHKVNIYVIYYKICMIIYELSATAFDASFLYFTYYKEIIMALEITMALIYFYLMVSSRNRLMDFFIAGSVFLLIGSLVGQYILINQQNSNGVIVMEGGVILELLLFSLGLGYRIKVLNDQKRRAQEDLIAQLKNNEKIQAEANKALENKVAERTRELESQNKDLQASNEEKAILMSEIHHRVKNNLQIISSLLNLQSRQLNNKAKNAVLESRNRVHVMGLLHEKLYQKDQYAHILMDEYIKQLVNNLIKSYSLPENKIGLTIEVSNDLYLDVDTAVPLGLIINELVSNSLKHAFGGIERPSIKIRLNIEYKVLKLCIEDNGNGFSKNVDFEHPTSFGLRLVKSLVEKMEGEIYFDSSEGTSIILYTYNFKLVSHKK